MGRYSLEPPRKHLHLHHTYDAIGEDENRVLDTGPHANHGSIVGDVELRVPGIDGDAIRVRGNEIARVQVNDEVGDTDTITASTWVNYDTATRFDLQGFGDRRFGDGEFGFPTGSSATWQLSLDGALESISWEYPEEMTGWHFYLGWYDGSDMRLYHGTDTEMPELVASQSATGTVTSDFLLTADILFSARVDDTRVYTTDLDREQQDNLWRMAAEHVISPAVADVWPTPGLPYDEGDGNERFAASLAEKSSRIERVLDAVLEARHIDDAAGPQLDRIGDLLGVRRKTDEADATYRARIKATAIAGRSAGTFEDILNGIASIIQTDPTRVRLRRDDAAIATCEVTVQTTDVSDAPITVSDLNDAAQDLVIAGHDITIVESSANAFTLKEDGDTDDASLGLTSDSISTGGTLVEDL